MPLTALFAATIGLFQYDIKKVLAYSTVSQLGFMFIGVGVGAYWAGAFHLLTHACFKSVLVPLLRLGDSRHAQADARARARDASRRSRRHRRPRRARRSHGHNEHKPFAVADPRVQADPIDPQDMRNMGGLGTLMPVTRWSYLVACWAIAGFPWRRDFPPRDEISVEGVRQSVSTKVSGQLIWAVGPHRRCLHFVLHVPLLLHDVLLSRADRRTQSARARGAEVDHRRAWSCRTGGLSRWRSGRCSAGFPSLFTGKELLLAQWLSEPVTSLSNKYLSGGRAFYENHTVEMIFMAHLHRRCHAGMVFRATVLPHRRRVGIATRLPPWRDELLEHSLAHSSTSTASTKFYSRGIVVRGFQLTARAMSFLVRRTRVIDLIVNMTGTPARRAAWIGGAIDKYLVDGAVNGVAFLFLDGGRQVAPRANRTNQQLRSGAVVVGVVLLVVITSLV